MKFATPNEDPKNSKKNLRHALHSSFGRQMAPKAVRAAVAIDTNDILMGYRSDTSARPNTRCADIKELQVAPRITVPCHAADATHWGPTIVENADISATSEIPIQEETKIKYQKNLAAAVSHETVEDSVGTPHSDIIPTSGNYSVTVKPRKCQKSTVKRKKPNLYPVAVPADASSVSSPPDKFSTIADKN